MDDDTELERLYSNWLAGRAASIDEVMVAIGRYLGLTS